MRSPPHPEWITPDWPAEGRVRALITTRAGGVSSGKFASLNLSTRVGDDAQCVARNRAILRACLPAEPAWMKQVHGTAVIDATRATPDTEADAAVTRDPGAVCAVMTADCLPLLLSDRAGKRVGIAHAGWRGLAGGVIENVVQAMQAARVGRCRGNPWRRVLHRERGAFLFLPSRPDHRQNGEPHLAGRRRVAWRRLRGSLRRPSRVA